MPTPADQAFGGAPAAPADQAFSQPKAVPAEQAFDNPDVAKGNVSVPAGKYFGAGGAQLPESLKNMDLDNVYIGVKPDSMVGKAMQTMAVPLRAETGVALKAAALLDIPGAKELNQKLNPEGKIVPDAYMSDISDFYIDKAAQAAGVPQIPGVTGDVLRAAVKSSKFGVGLGANILLDPLTGVKVGQLTKEAEAIEKMGGTVMNPSQVAKGAEPLINSSGLTSPAAQQKNLAGYRVPLTDVGFDIKGQAVQDAISKVGGTRPVKAMATMVRALSPDTGNPILDQAGRTHDNLMRGDPVDVINRHIPGKKALGLNEEEDRLASSLVESSANLAHPELPKELLDAARAKPIEGGGETVAGLPDFWGSESEIRGQMAQALPAAAKKLRIELPPGRQEALLEAAMTAKRADAENILDKYHAGVLTPENMANKVMENHLPHVMNPSYKGVANAKDYEARLAKDASDVKKVTNGTFVSSRDITRERTIRGTLDETNAQMAEKTGLKSFFVTDPVAATTARLIQSKKLLRDSQYLDVVKDFGQRMTPAEAREAGYVPIQHPELSGKTVVIKDAKGNVSTAKIQDLYFPKEIASKVQYRIAKPALTGLISTLFDYNRAFRSMIFMSSPGIRLGNAADNVFKTAAITGSDFMRASKDSVAVLLGKSEGFRTDPTPARPNGTFYSGAALKSLVDKYGLTKTGAWSEGMENFINAGKKLTMKEAMESPQALGPKYAWERAKDLIRTVDTFGEHGENTARVALFLQRLRAGWEPEQAAGEVTKWLFDYNRNSPTMEGARMIFPFLQHPLKTAMLAPKLLGTAPGAYNFIQNSFPHVVANAFHDPVTQAELNTILPDHIKQRDAIAGPFISGNTWMSAIFGSGGKLGSMGWFDPRIGLRILNHFNYFSKGGADRALGETSPVIQALVGGVGGRGDFGKSLDYANGNVNVANRVNYALGKIIGGVVPFPNAEKMAMQSFGLVDPQHIEPNTVLILKGLAGQFGGITNLDRDVNSKLLATHYAYEDQKKQFINAVHTEMKSNVNASSLARYVKSEYGSITGTSPLDMFKQMNQSVQETGEAQMGTQALGGGMRAGDFAARMKGLAAEMARLNQAYQTWGAQYLEMSKGSKSPAEARAKIGQ